MGGSPRAASKWGPHGGPHLHAGVEPAGDHHHQLLTGLEESRGAGTGTAPNHWLFPVPSRPGEMVPAAVMPQLPSRQVPRAGQNRQWARASCGLESSAGAVAETTHVHTARSSGGARSHGAGLQQGCLTPSRASQVNQGNMPGIQSTFLAMDTEEGVEVVWNELLFTDKKAFKAHEVSHPSPAGTVPTSPETARCTFLGSSASPCCSWAHVSQQCELQPVMLCSCLHGIVPSLGFSLRESSMCPLYPKTSFPCDPGHSLLSSPRFPCSQMCPAASQDLPPHPSSLCPQEKIKTMFEQLVLVDHPNIVKLHKYWLDVKDLKARVGRSQGGKVSRGFPGWGRDAGGSQVGIPALLTPLPGTPLPSP